MVLKLAMFFIFLAVASSDQTGQDDSDGGPHFFSVVKQVGAGRSPGGEADFGTCKTEIVLMNVTPGRQEIVWDFGGGGFLGEGGYSTG